MRRIIRCATLEWHVLNDRGIAQWCDEFLGADAQTRVDILRDLKRQIDARYAQALRETGEDPRVINNGRTPLAPSPAAVPVYQERERIGA